MLWKLYFQQVSVLFRGLVLYLLGVLGHGVELLFRRTPLFVRAGGGHMELFQGLFLKWAHFATFEPGAICRKWA